VVLQVDRFCASGQRTLIVLTLDPDRCVQVRGNPVGLTIPSRCSLTHALRPHMRCICPFYGPGLVTDLQLDQHGQTVPRTTLTVVRPNRPAFGPEPRLDHTFTRLARRMPFTDPALDPRPWTIRAYVTGWTDGLADVEHLIVDGFGPDKPADSA